MKNLSNPQDHVHNSYQFIVEKFLPILLTCVYFSYRSMISLNNLLKTIHVKRRGRKNCLTFRNHIISYWLSEFSRALNCLQHSFLAFFFQASSIHICQACCMMICECIIKITILRLKLPFFQIKRILCKNDDIENTFQISKKDCEKKNLLNYLHDH